MSLDRWNQLPKAVQTAFENAGPIAQKDALNEIVPDETKWWKQVEDLGAKVKLNQDIDVAAFKAKMVPVWDQFFGSGDNKKLLDDVQKAIA
jgi:TRAP-type C4-dicarboxylate transport system substrate-binding protein